MYIPPTKVEIIQQCRDFYKALVNQVKPTAFPLNVSLTSNPFIRDRDAFKFLKFQLSEYNRRVERCEVTDPYEMLSYQKLHSMLSDLAQIDSRENQVTALEDLNGWFKEQSRLMQQRTEQGDVRYEMSKLYRDITRLPEEKKIEEVQQELNIPFYMIERIVEPYRRHSRTLHPELDNPAKRLGEYKRKTINIATFAENKEDQRPPRVLYPVPPKYEEPKEEQPEKPLQGQEGVPPPAEGAEVPPVDGQPAAVPAENAPEEQPGAPDMGGFGEQPEQPDEDEPVEQVPDKLKPKNPVYVDAVSVDKEKKYKESYMFYQGVEAKEERGMELRYIRKYHEGLRRQREDAMQTEVAHEWAQRKAKIAKQMQKKLEEMKFKPIYSFSKEPAPVQQKIGLQDQLRFGFTTVARARPKHPEFDLSLNELPRLAPFDEKTIRRDRLNSLKGKFGKLLNLAEQQSRQSAPSLCQYTQRRRGLSEIIRNHSHSKQRLNQLQEVGKIKERLTKVKINVNIKALARGLCLPENEDFFQEGERQFPNKELPSNPNMVETKKKKKKKK